MIHPADLQVSGVVGGTQNMDSLGWPELNAGLDRREDGVLHIVMDAMLLGTLRPQ